MNLSSSKRRLLWWVWVAAIGVVVIGSLLPASWPVLLPLRRVNDKLLHFLAYTVLGLLPMIWAQSRRAAVLPVLAMFVLGLLLDWAQGFVPGRSFELGDLLADDLGVVCGVFLGGRLGR